VQLLLKTAYETAVRIIRDHRSSLGAIAGALLRYETISGEDVKRLMSGASIESLRPNAPPARAPGLAGADRPVPSPSPKVSPGDLPGAAGLSPA
jgi:cell division protease FtsH